MNAAPSAAVSPPDASRAASLVAALRERLSPAARVTAPAPLAARTTLRVGGPADVLIEPADEADLARALRFCHDRGLPWRALGRGSNLLVRDGGVREWMLRLGRPAFRQITVRGNRLFCGAGVPLPLLGATACRHGLAGLEFLEGIPGSVGGALRMNAGAHRAAIFDVVERVRGFDRAGRRHEWTPDRLAPRYRECAFLRDHLAVEAVFVGRPDDPAAIRRRRETLQARRRRTQPSEPSAGCVFKNPAGRSAGELIEACGLKGAREGGARVSPRHANFIINAGGATAADLERLICRVQQTVRERAGVDLEREIEILGEHPAPPPCPAP
jgi:UDP-N-acetylenolpyruvoylglucosamine reductase